MLDELINKLKNKFTQTIFLKKGSELEEQIKALKVLLEKHPNNEALQNELALCEIGLRGEREIEFELSNANIGMYVLHDVNIKYQDLKAQIDYIIITPAKKYFVECKNLIGNITIDNNGNFIREYQYGNRKIKEGFYSPVTQAKRHIEIYKKIWMEKNTGILDKTIRLNNFDRFNVPLVVMSNQKNIINDRYAPKDIKKLVIRSDRLIDYLRKDINETNKDYLDNQKQMEQKAEKLLNEYVLPIQKNYEEDYIAKFNLLSAKDDNANKSFETTKEIKTNEPLADDLKEKLKNKLLEFRKNKSKEKGIPAYYIYNNEELNGILELLPKTIDELKNSKILNDTKVRLHGEEIIRIINDINNL